MLMQSHEHATRPLQGVLILWAYWHTRAETGREPPRFG